MHYGCKTATGRLMQTSYLLFFAERGLLFTPLQESYSCYGFLVTHSWIKMLWEKLSMFNIFRSRGALSYSECSTALNLPHTIQEFAESQDVIWWDNFVMGMAFSKLLPIQSDYLLYSKFSHATCWISGFITQLLQVTHTLWIYQCVLVHDRTTGTLISAHKEVLLKKFKNQLTLGPEGLAEEDRFLLECNFDNTTTTTPFRMPERHHASAQRHWLHSSNNATPIAPRDGHKFGISTHSKQGTCLESRLCSEQFPGITPLQEGESSLSVVPTATLLCR